MKIDKKIDKKVVGIVIAKENSSRFPGKNYYIVNNKPLFAHAIDLMLNSGIEDIYVATNSKKIINSCKTNAIPYLFRGENVSEDEEGYFSVLKWAYKSVDRRYDIVVTILANSYKHDNNVIINGIGKLKDSHVSEVRSFDSDGNQSGVFLFRSEAILDKHEMSGHMAAVKSDGVEIHYKKELQ